MIRTDQTTLAIENVDSFQRCAFLCASDAKKSCRGFNTKVSGDEVSCERVMENTDTIVCTICLPSFIIGYKMNEFLCGA